MQRRIHPSRAGILIGFSRSLAIPPASRIIFDTFRITLYFIAMS
jgi:hypothetical protein